MNSVLRVGNALITMLMRAGLPVGVNFLLTVRGRKSGLPRTTPVAVVERNGRRYLVAAYGAVDWVRNLRAAGLRHTHPGRRSEAITVAELPPDEAAVILKDSLRNAPSFLRTCFAAPPDAPLAAFVREAVRHPVFEVNPVVP